MVEACSLPGRYSADYVDPAEPACPEACGCGAELCAAYCQPAWRLAELRRDCPEGTEPWFDAARPAWVCRQERRRPLNALHDPDDRDAAPRSVPACEAGRFPVCRQFVCQRVARRHNGKPRARCNMDCGPAPETPPRCPRGGVWACNRCTGLRGCFTNLPSHRSRVQRGASNALRTCPRGTLPVCVAPPVCTDPAEELETEAGADARPGGGCTYRCPGLPPGDMCLGDLVARCDACTGRYGCVRD